MNRDQLKGGSLTEQIVHLNKEKVSHSKLPVFDHLVDHSTCKSKDKYQEVQTEMRLPLATVKFITMTDSLTNLLRFQ